MSKRLLLLITLVSCEEGSDPPDDRALQFNPQNEESDDLSIGVHEGVEFWSLRAEVLRQRRGSITISFDEPPPKSIECAVGWANIENPCKPIIGMKDGWQNAWQVGAHEIGHVSGLGHSSNPKSIMYGGGLRPSSVESTNEQEDAVWVLTYTLEICRFE